MNFTLTNDLQCIYWEKWKSEENKIHSWNLDCLCLSPHIIITVIKILRLKSDENYPFLWSLVGLMKSGVMNERVVKWFKYKREAWMQSKLISS